MIEIKVFDFEATDKYAAIARPLSFACVTLSIIDLKYGLIDFKDPIQFYINDPTLTHIPIESQRIHGITMEDIREKGIPVGEAADIIYETLQLRNIAGFNNEDYDNVLLNNFLLSQCYKYKYNNSYDVMRIYQSKYGGRRKSNHNVFISLGNTEDMIEEYLDIFKEKVETKGVAHDALYDSIKTGLSLTKLLEG